MSISCESCQPGARPLTAGEMLEQEFEALYGELPRKYRELRKRCLNRHGRQDCDEGLKKALYGYIHDRAKRLESGQDVPAHAALCLSGGGIRSATFALGVLQGLAKYNLLRQCDYLSTVSGGGYVGGWLSGWIHRDPGGFSGVCAQLRKSVGRKSETLVAPDVACKGDEDDEPKQIRHLREYSNYLTPHLGILRPDSWTLLAIYLRNLLLTWSVLVPLLAGLLMLPRVYFAALSWHPTILDAAAPEARALQGVLRFLIMVLSMVGIVAAIVASPRVNQRVPGRSPLNRQSPQNHTNAMQALGQREVICWIVLPVVFSAIFFSFRRAWIPFAPNSDSHWSGILWGAVFYGVAPLLARFVVWWRAKPNPPHLLALTLALTVAGVMAGWLAWETKGSSLVGSIQQSGVLAKPRIHALLTVPFVLSLYLLIVTVYVGLTSGKPGGDADREWWARLSGWLLSIAIGWLAIVSVSLFGPSVGGWVFHDGRRSGLNVAAAIIVILLVLLGLAGGHSESSGQRGAEHSQTPRARWASLVPSLSAPLAILLLALLLAAATDRILQKVIDIAGSGSVELWGRDEPVVEKSVQLHHSATTLGWTAVTAGAAFALAMMAGLFMNSNRLSLHAMYRDRLIRAFLGASRNQRSPDAFTGFDPEDNLPMHHLRRGQFTEEELNTTGDASERIVQIAEVLRWRGDLFAEYIWHQIGEQIRLINKEFDRAHEEGMPPASDRLRGPVFDALNKLLCDQDLYLYTEFRDPSSRLRFPQIAAAFEALSRDGRPHILNRLILEELFCRRPAKKDPPDKKHGDADRTGDHPEKLPGECDEQLLKPDGQTPRPPRPLHVINLALNLVEGGNLAWQQRKARSFTISPLHCGFDKGYRPAVRYGGPITLGTAMTISGAATTPNMGYHSSPAVTFLMTLFNVRLGWWLGNPSLNGRSTVYREPDPLQSIRPLLDEAFGRTNDEAIYVYLSDGGHFENLGLYEMVRRRCHYIIVSDASHDPGCKFQDLANAVQKIQVDLGIPIDLREVRVFPKVKRLKRGRYCAVGEIRYSAVDPGAPPGVLIYLKPARHKCDAIDLYYQGQSNKHFPHEPTANQWFSESQFESYRKLGLETVEAICRHARKPELRLKEFIDLATVEAMNGRSNGTLRRKKTQTRANRYGPYPFETWYTDQAPDSIGVYRLQDESGEVIYIGAARGNGSTIRSRLRAHLRGKEGPSTRAAAQFTCEETTDKTQASTREKELLDDFKRTHKGKRPRCQYA